jgi:hypothetical protein
VDLHQRAAAGRIATAASRQISTGVWPQGEARRPGCRCCEEARPLPPRTGHGASPWLGNVHKRAGAVAVGLRGG